MDLIDKIKEFLGIGVIKFSLFTKRKNGLCSLYDIDGKEIKLFQLNKIFIKKFLKVSVKHYNYEFIISNKKFKSYQFSLINIDKESIFEDLLSYQSNNYNLEFCSSHLLYYFKGKVPKTIYIQVNKLK